MTWSVKKAKAWAYVSITINAAVLFYLFQCDDMKGIEGARLLNICVTFLVVVFSCGSVVNIYNLVLNMAKHRILKGSLLNLSLNVFAVILFCIIVHVLGCLIYRSRHVVGNAESQPASQAASQSKTNFDAALRGLMRAIVSGKNISLSEHAYSTIISEIDSSDDVETLGAYVYLHTISSDYSAGSIRDDCWLLNIRDCCVARLGAIGSPRAIRLLLNLSDWADAGFALILDDVIIRIGKPALPRLREYEQQESSWAKELCGEIEKGAVVGVPGNNSIRAESQPKTDIDTGPKK